MCAAIVFLGDQPPMPREQGFGSNQRRDVLQHAVTQRLGLLRKSPPLIVSEANALSLQLFAENTIFFSQVFNRILLLLIGPPRLWLSPGTEKDREKAAFRLS